MLLSVTSCRWPFGAAARGRIGLLGGFTAGAGAFLTAHLGLRGLPIPAPLQAFDWYLGVGLGVDFLPSFMLGFAGLLGINYFINPGFAVFLENVAWRGLFDTTLGVRPRLT